jgi:hypothetical protein
VEARRALGLPVHPLINIAARLERQPGQEG